ncbi:two-component system, OmpR family, alkaline phosphatase synthesis response regulator PhoP/two-component system, cell cycle response regulator CtrA [Poseidonocella pacifica]|uniref:Two-component system, OmpR family, alkaline phosphatase synthesis response regulator PhoP/two-component system, cell cycle response regulator CtrA n=1 Tax=Poseidonocella pacifica TaxID=871651 RepID=A0A1I0Z083_9RHOB|nr:response regulator transcription factor [Poseidonocella pacifica]SFB18516.1 two-component system, OmpR family, alkaline phosphatase synthesis response regulator PhoP/two-component system, cell cycle response regulator CtrA [Poseidonocella pacifica]
MRILIADTTWATAGIAKGLRDAGFLITSCDAGEYLASYTRTARQNAIVLDTDSGGPSPFEVIMQLRDAAPTCPIVFIDGRGDETLRTRLLNAGADDVIDASSDRDVVVSRIGAVARRAAGLSQPLIELGDLRVDLLNRVVFAPASRVPLSPKEYELLEHLALNRKRMVTRDELLSQIYAFENEPTPRIIDVFVCKIRSKLATAGSVQVVIETVRGRGYRLSEVTGPTPPLDNAADAHKMDIAA